MTFAPSVESVRAIRSQATSPPGSARRALGAGCLLAGLVRAAIAQDLAATTETLAGGMKVVVTGSNIPTLDRETAVPVQIITRGDIERANLQTAAELVSTISAAMSFGAFNEAQGLGSIGQPGFAGAGLRGLGYQATLILLNGRRIANFAFTTLGGDLNAIPLSAVERVEVLTNGASAIYGSDAVAGVINFILRKDYRGAEVYAQYTSPEQTGGYGKHFNASGGYGDLSSQKFNVYAVFDYMEFGGIEARNRPFAARSYFPDEGLDRTSINSFPANVSTPAGVRNPTGDPASGYSNPSCAPPLSFPTAGSANQFQCRWNGDGTASIFNPSERLGFAGALTWQLDRDRQVFVNGTYTQNTFTFVTLPTQVSSQTTLQGIRRFLLPPSSAFYPHDFARDFGIDGLPLNVFWSATELGTRTIEVESNQLNVVAGMRGAAMGWNYDGAFSYSRSDVEQRAADGYVRESVLLPIVNSGTVNPFGANTQAVVDRMSVAKFDGTLRTGKATTTSLDFKANREVGALAAGPLTVAVGFDARRDDLVQTSDPALESGDILNVASASALSGSRDVVGVFAEANAALLPTLEANVALRYDHYSDFGGTTNPSIALRWEPVPTLVVRGSAGTGYFAPSLAGLFRQPVYGYTVESLSDAARCPTTQAARDCNRQFPVLGGGNPALRPTTSSQWSVGAVWAPTRDFLLGADYVSILLDDRINFFSSQQIFAQCPDGVSGPTCFLIHRGPVEPSYPALPGPIIQVDQFLTNLGKQKVTAIDVNARFAAPSREWGRFKATFTGTYTIQNLRQQLDGSYVNQVGHYTTSGGNPGVIPYWRHDLTLDWNHGPWSATVTENFQTGGYDQSPGPDTGTTSRVIGNYDLWNLRLAYTGFRNLTLSAGIKNLFDSDPPFSNQTQNFQVGYDPSYADPHGRLYWVGLGYAFH
jgi:iron complex outermembrane receptor protein